ncbi:hypothetical protein NYQ35_02405 [Curtobacterium flaccumfaciens pv. flaccumfaciens]|jgi:hypothetical protein|uniref:hypothetical protein n=1 Tax=Curtobacterium flaccumfaciens TaxID=2035 RepID=UPI001BDEC22A|nr:hypothetical protein [Curtobacterium flaccumfaciens]MBT1633508.1 hypothetical protein [Curtobacterium flaccumfaciens pv. oortii]MCS6567643.1 hypothetical protein [Curtobacterium flaccumfaciens pv. flaccumfaciens]MCS6585725.1 hypothetical protein [Curtobacterium flaccumfaciens pv. flaccumfaciens]MCX2843494.1 hypothetical protein [Curtobacterium flaccumfaciens pv. oortii]
MNNNPAELLLNYFNTTVQQARQAYTPRILFNALGECEDVLKTWDRLGKPVSAYTGAIPRWSEAIAMSWNAAMTYPNPHASKPDEGDMGMLLLLANEMRAFVPELTAEKQDEVSDLIHKVLAALKDDTSLPPELRAHIATLIIQVEQCIAEYEIRGDFALRDAVERLIANIRLAEQRSDDPAKWERLWDEYAKPVILGLLVEIPTIGLAIAQLSITT